MMIELGIDDVHKPTDHIYQQTNEHCNIQGLQFSVQVLKF
jgi:hypothetical protein